MAKEILSKKGRQLEIWLAFLFIAGAAALRLLPHPPNFAPIAALALFGGVYLTRKFALGIPILALLISDIFIGFYTPVVMVSVYGSFVLCGLIGVWLRKRKKWPAVLGGSILGAILFFIITNFAVWAFTPWYVKTLAGLIQCYAMALPFFRNTLLGNVFYVGVFFGAYELVKVWVSKKYQLKKTVFQRVSKDRLN